MARSYEPKNGDYASLIEDLDKAALDDLVKEQQASMREHQRHSQQVPESFASLQEIKEGKFSYAKAEELDRKTFKDNFAVKQKEAQSFSEPLSVPPFTSSPHQTSQRPSAREGAKDSKSSGYRTVLTVFIAIIIAILFVFEDYMDEGLMFFLYAAMGIFVLAMVNGLKTNK